jgi:GNAT superfamily N-acetyltransferase
MNPATEAISLAAASPADLATVRRLADAVWHRHYPGSITVEQIDYLLERGYGEAALGRFLVEPGAGLALARVGGEPAGFAAWCRADEPATTKLDKLYVLQEHQRRGVGRRLIALVEEAARADGAGTLILNVNKRNLRSIDAYRRCGFAVREEVVVDIGRGFVMDDFVMAKPLAASPGSELR